VLQGSGPGTFQLLWERLAPIYSYVVNAHSLYIETFAEVGAVGLALLVGFFLLLLGAAVRAVMRSEHEARARAAGAAAALLAFMVSASFDWVWQLPVLPVAFLLLAAAVLAPGPRPVWVRTAAALPDDTGGGARRRRVPVRVGLVVTAVACLVAIGVPLAEVSAVRQSQAAVAAGDTTLALADARSAVRLEPGAGSAQLQVALVLELKHDFPAALAAARKATRDEPQDSSEWLVLSRLEAEAGHVKASIAAYDRARSLDPRSPLFQT